MRLPTNDPITNKFNDPRTRHLYTPYGLEGHDGIDFAVSQGTKVYAPHDGTVYNGTENLAGKYVYLDNGKEVSLLAHLNRWIVESGVKVKEGQHVGYSGNTGYSIGAHLHWGYFRHPRNNGNGFGGYIDPLKYLEGETSVDYKKKYEEAKKEIKKLEKESEHNRDLWRNRVDAMSFLTTKELTQFYRDHLRREPTSKELKEWIKTNRTDGRVTLPVYMLNDRNKRIDELKKELEAIGGSISNEQLVALLKSRLGVN